VSSPLLKVNNLEAVYHSVVRVLRGVSLEVPVGGVVALLGPNGAGKTTTLRAITGLLAIHEGRVSKGLIELDGTSLVGVRADTIVARGVAQVMEGRRVFAELTVEENLMAGAWAAKAADARADLDRYYQRFPILGDRRRQAAGYLSGGEQQMLAIARALMSRPRLLLLDEPSLGLAPRIVEDVARLIREINEEGVSILLVEQNAAVALELADHAYVLETGKVVLDGTAEELKNDADVQEFYLGMGGGERRSYRDVKHYRRRKRWLS
jgi:branched-chain amino acid transport system ATP-binding protein